MHTDQSIHFAVPQMPMQCRQHHEMDFSASLACYSTCLHIVQRVCKRFMHAGKWTVQQAAELSVAAPTIEAALDGRFLSGLKEQRVKAAEYYNSRGLEAPKQLEVIQTFHGHPGRCSSPQCCRCPHRYAAAQQSILPIMFPGWTFRMS